MNINLKHHSHVKEFFHKFSGKLEDTLFSIILAVPEPFIPKPVMNWMDSYTTKRINQLKQQTTKQVWEQLYLQKAVDDIRKRQ